MGSTRKMSVILSYVTLLCFTTQSYCQVGFEKWVSDNPVEFESIEVEWEKERPVPEWLSGTYLKNGPALSQFGGEKRYANVGDGWGKINKFNINSNSVKVSASFSRLQHLLIAEKLMRLFRTSH